jgi:hypothetical protein
MNNSLRLTVITLLLPVSNLSADWWYVSPGSEYSNIQQAVDAAAAGDEIDVDDGVYPGGVVVDKPLTLVSFDGPEFTVIDGGGSLRCVYLTNGANLFGFTLAKGVAANGGGVLCQSTSAVLSNCVLTGNIANGSDGFGGGACGGTLNNCTLTGNSTSWAGGGASGGVPGPAILNNCTLSDNSANVGGGAQAATLNNCTLTGNSASDGGGGAFGCTLYDCTLTGNSASVGGGAGNSTLNSCTVTGNSAVNDGGVAYECKLNNCIVYFNTASGSANYDSHITLNYCCSTPLATNGAANITNAPLFVDYTSGNLRLESNSPCINAGNNAYVTTTTDLDGRPRIVGGTVDIGAYEFQPGVSGAFIGWLEQYGLPTDGSADFADADGDGMNNWQEWFCGTCPTNRLSALRLLSVAPAGTNTTVTWQSVAGVNYVLERRPDLALPFTLVATNIIGQAGTTTYADTNATGAGPFFYRVGVKSP